MISGQIRQHLLTDELQLGQSLNQAIHHGHRAQFSLLLSMLCADVPELPQFGLADKPMMKKPEADLRAEFGLGKPVPIRGPGISADRAKSFSELTAQGLNASVRLQQLLQPTPLCQNDPTGGLGQEVLDNVSLKARLQWMEKLNKIVPEPVKYDDISMNQIIEGFDYNKELKLNKLDLVA
ncbi:hypothetical protein K6Y31_01620 [Motilimonas cestriensis]|uniref:Uncharacterized protein n=1 Tax=Motilimonas cestriensis TaxID=2742685 RepID=A0ABS8W3K6_9GAMM|nr:VC2046/SO_2500 family protein [Motilimonas cestriensis]MCE2593514.1 hypothetical protein [Motilimonas cestriensis]